MSKILEAGSALATLVNDERLMSLGPGTPNLAVQPALERLDPATAFAPHEVSDRMMAAACLAGVWLYHDFLDQSHRISQAIGTPTGSYWHAILHRREPDSWNSKYWFERLGQHPVFPELCAAARALARSELEWPEIRFLSEQRHWDPFGFVDLCENCRRGSVAADLLCRKIQLVEWQLLFQYGYQQATAGH